MGARARRERPHHREEVLRARRLPGFAANQAVHQDRGELQILLVLGERLQALLDDLRGRRLRFCWRDLRSREQCLQELLFLQHLVRGPRLLKALKPLPPVVDRDERLFFLVLFRFRPLRRNRPRLSSLGLRLRLRLRFLVLLFGDDVDFLEEEGCVRGVNIGGVWI